MACLVNAYHEEEVKGDTRVVMRFHPRMAPIKAAILPLVKRDGMPEIARTITEDLRRHFRVEYDEGGALWVDAIAAWMRWALLFVSPSILKR